MAFTDFDLGMTFYSIKQIMQQTSATKAGLSEWKKLFQYTNYELTDFQRHKKIKTTTV